MWKPVTPTIRHPLLSPSPTFGHSSALYRAGPRRVVVDAAAGLGGGDRQADRQTSLRHPRRPEGAKFWLRVVNELKGRGAGALLIAVVDGLKGFPEAITTAFPGCVVQTCLVHLIRYSLQFASWKERKRLARVLKAIYTAAASAEAAAAELDRFEARPYGDATRQWSPVGADAGRR